MQDAGEDVNPIAAPFTPPQQEARTTNHRQNNDAMTRTTVPYRRVKSPEAQKELMETALFSKEEGKHYWYGDVEEGFLKLTQLISKQRGETIEFLPNYYLINARTGELRGTSGKGNSKNWGSSAGEAVNCMCRVKGSQGPFENRPGFKKSHLALAAVQPDIPVDTADHINGDYNDNSIFNLDNVSQEENSRRKNFSKTGEEASRKSALTRSHRYRMLDDNRNEVKVFDTKEEARLYLVENKKTTAKRLSQLSTAVSTKGTAYGHFWERVNPGPTRKAVVGGDPLKIVELKKLKGRYQRYQEQIETYLRKRGKGTRPPPAKFSNYGEVMNNLGIWTKGEKEKRKCDSKTRSACNGEMHHWMMLAFHEDRDEVERWLNKDGDKELVILHKDGDKNKDGEFHHLTHEDEDDSKPYTNYYFTLRFGTRAENRDDRSTKEARTPKKPRLNND